MNLFALWIYQAYEYFFKEFEISLKEIKSTNFGLKCQTLENKLRSREHTTIAELM